MLLRMFQTAASPEFVLRAGKVYNVPRAIAKRLSALKAVTGGARKKDHKGNETGETEATYGGPVAEIITPDQLRKKEKVLAMPARPDPEDIPPSEIDEDFEMVGDAEDAE